MDRKPGPLVMVVAILCVLIGTPFGVYLTGNLVKDWKDWLVFETGGVTTQGTVTQVQKECWTDSESNQRCVYEVKYRFQVPKPVNDQNVFSNTGKVWESLFGQPPPRNGSTVKIVYLPDNPQVSRLTDYEDPILGLIIRTVFILGLWIAMILLVLFGFKLLKLPSMATRRP